MTDLEWTDEPPEEPGWYNYRAKPSYGRRIVEVSWTHDNRLLRVKTTNTNGYLPLSELNTNEAQWAGPIPEPE